MFIQTHCMLVVSCKLNLFAHLDGKGSVALEQVNLKLSFLQGFLTHCAEVICLFRFSELIN